MRLGDVDIQIIDGDRGKNYPNKFTDNGYCLFLSAKNVTSTGFSFDEKQFITKKQDELLRKGKITENDVVLTTRGTVGNVAFYNNDVPFENVRINSGMVILRSNTNIIVPKFLYYVMKSSDIQNQILQMRTGSAQPQFPISHMVNLEIPIPPLTTQQKIADTLSVLDAKISNNTKINHHLEQVAQTIFKSWFVDTKTSKVRKLAELFTFVKGKKPSTISEMSVEGFLPYLTIDAMTSNVVTFADPSKMVIAKPDDILMVMDGASSGTIYFGKIGIVGSTFALVEMKDPAMREIVFQALKFYECEVKQHNTGSAIPHADKGFVFQLELPIPDDITEATTIFAALRRDIIRNTKESTRLATLRNTLLPRLMSGELSVADPPVK
jgi:type I restriction enzyme S subunit